MNSTNSTNSTTTATSTNTSTQQVVTALVSNGTIFGVFVIAFLILRIKLKRIYEPKSSFNLINEEKSQNRYRGAYGNGWSRYWKNQTILSFNKPVWMDISFWGIFSSLQFTVLFPWVIYSLFCCRLTPVTVTMKADWINWPIRTSSTVVDILHMFSVDGFSFGGSFTLFTENCIFTPLWSKLY